jgi:hypothetical protein
MKLTGASAASPGRRGPARTSQCCTVHSHASGRGTLGSSRSSCLSRRRERPRGSCVCDWADCGLRYTGAGTAICEPTPSGPVSSPRPCVRGDSASGASNGGYSGYHQAAVARPSRSQPAAHPSRRPGLDFGVVLLITVALSRLLLADAPARQVQITGRPTPCRRRRSAGTVGSPGCGSLESPAAFAGPPRPTAGHVACSPGSGGPAYDPINGSPPPSTGVVQRRRMDRSGHRLPLVV